MGTMHLVYGEGKVFPWKVYEDNGCPDLNEFPKEHKKTYQVPEEDYQRVLQNLRSESDANNIKGYPAVGAKRQVFPDLDDLIALF
jgi:hypothetical protein